MMKTEVTALNHTFTETQTWLGQLIERGLFLPGPIQQLREA